MNYQEQALRQEKRNLSAPGPRPTTQRALLLKPHDILRSAGPTTPEEQLVVGGKCPPKRAGFALRCEHLPFHLSSATSTQVESRSRSESPGTVFVNGVLIIRHKLALSAQTHLVHSLKGGSILHGRMEWNGDLHHEHWHEAVSPSRATSGFLSLKRVHVVAKKAKSGSRPSIFSRIDAAFCTRRT